MDFSLYRYYYLFIKKESIYKERKKVTRDEHSGPLLGVGTGLESTYGYYRLGSVN
jgi:hypothetical protein